MPDTTVTDVVYEFLGKPGVTNLSKAILTKVNSRIEDRIVTSIDDASDDSHVPSALAVYTAPAKYVAPVPSIDVFHPMNVYPSLVGTSALNIKSTPYCFV